MVSLDGCDENSNTLNDLSSRISVPYKADANLNAFNMIARTNQ